MGQSLLLATVKSGLRGLLLQELCSGSGQNGGLLPRVLWLGGRRKADPPPAAKDDNEKGKAKQIFRLRRRMTTKRHGKSRILFRLRRSMTSFFRPSSGLSF
jgi:hypothetical protein